MLKFSITNYLWGYKTSEVSKYLDNLKTTLIVFKHTSSTSACLWIIQLELWSSEEENEEAFILNGLKRPNFPTVRRQRLFQLHRGLYQKTAPPTTPPRLSSQVG